MFLEPLFLFFGHIAGNGVNINWLAHRIHTGKLRAKKSKFFTAFRSCLFIRIPFQSADVLCRPYASLS
jgi:hypothetical protein